MNSSDEEDSSSVSRSPSPALSLEQQQEQEEDDHDSTPPTLERLVLYFVSAKRSLTSTSHVYRANSLTNDSRSLVQEIAALAAKNTFARRALSSQIEILSAIRDNVHNEGHHISHAFDSKVLDLDAAHERLGETLSSLRDTIVSAKEDQDQDEESKTLYSFIDDSTHETILASIRSTIDIYHETRSKDFETPLNDLNSRIESLSTILSTSSAASSSADSLRMKPTTIYSRNKQPQGGIAESYHRLTANAQDLASLLSQLVKHYDLCVSALKHTEGGGEAARLAIDDGQEDSLYAARFEPMDAEEREAMLRVLVGDAEEVGDVVAEMEDLAQGMEATYEEIVAKAESSRSEHKALQGVMMTLKALRVGTLPSILQSTTRFSKEFWPEVEGQLEGKMNELAELVTFYGGFREGYGALLKEVRRREDAQVRARQIAERAQRELDRLFEVDREARERFVDDFGGVLPRDLGARFGLEDGGIRWVVGEEEELKE